MQVFRSFGAQLLPVPVGRGGPRPDVSSGCSTRHGPKLFYCQPSGSQPDRPHDGPDDAARRLLGVAARHQVPIVEDGFDGSLYYGARPAASAARRSIATASSSTSAPSRRSCSRAAPGLAGRAAADRSSGCRTAKQLADLHTQRR